MGNLLYSLPDDVTEPAQFNLGIISALSDLEGLYSEGEVIGTLTDEFFARMDSELDKLEKLVSRVESSLGRLYSQEIYKRKHLRPVFSEGFGLAPAMDLDPKHYKDVPPLEIDSETGELRLPLLASVSYLDRCTCRVVNFLGADASRLSSPSGVVSSKGRSYWKETLYSDTPVYADVNQVPWLNLEGLADVYTGGAAARLEIDFGNVVPINEVRFVPVSKHPMRILGIVLDIGDYYSSGTNLLSGGEFSSPNDLSLWSISPAGAASWSPEYKGSLLHGEGILTVAQTGIVSGYVGRPLNFGVEYIKVTDRPVLVSVEWLDAAGNSIVGTTRAFYLLDTNLVRAVSWSIVPPSEAVYFRVRIIRTGLDKSDLFYLLRVWLAPSLEVIPLGLDLVDAKTISIGRRFCRKMYVIVSQPNYELKPYVQTVSVNEKRIPEILGKFMIVVSSYTRELLSKLLGIISPEKKVPRFRYEYQLGFASIEPRFRIYYPRGRYVSVPITVPADLRQLTLSIDAPENNSSNIAGYLVLKGVNEVNQQILTDPKSSARFVLTDQRTSASVVVSDSTVTYSGSDILGDPDIKTFLAEVQYVTEVYSSRDVDRHMRLQLNFMPYVHYDRVKSIENTLRENSQLPGLPAPHYDPNLENISYAKKNESGGYEKKSMSGYCPVRVWIAFSDGETVVPDSLGMPQPGLVSSVSGELLQQQTIEIKSTPQTGQRHVVTSIRTQPVYVPKNRNLIRDASNPSAVVAALYWGAPTVDRSEWVRVKNYKYDWSYSGFVVNENPPPPKKIGFTNVTLNSVYADYWYVDTRPLTQVLSPASTPLNSGVTRNRTDYLTGRIPELNPYIKGVYEVYEYYIDDRGRLCFHPSSGLFSEREATITVSYYTMKLSPRVVIEMSALDVDSPNSVVDTPRLRGFTLFANKGILRRNS
jgi:hypothetical protein